MATLALGSGFLNAPAFGEKWENLKKWVEPRAEVVSVTGIANPAGAHGETRLAAGSTDTTVPSEETASPEEVVADGTTYSTEDTVADDSELRTTAVDASHSEATESGSHSKAAAGKDGGHHYSDCGSKTPVGGVCYAPQLKHAPFKWWKAGMSVGIVFLGMILSWLLCVQLYTRKNKKLVGLTERNKVLGAGYSFLANKYYLDTLYEKIIVRSIAHPISRGAYWFNQNVLDGIVNGAGTSTRKTAGWVYRNVDQKLVDGAVNGAGTSAENAGGALQPVQSGKVNQYGALLFGAAAIGALVLVIINF